MRRTARPTSAGPPVRLRRAQAAVDAGDRARDPHALVWRRRHLRPWVRRADELRELGAFPTARFIAVFSSLPGAIASKRSLLSIVLEPWSDLNVLPARVVSFCAVLVKRCLRASRSCLTHLGDPVEGRQGQATVV